MIGGVEWYPLLPDVDRYPGETSEKRTNKVRLVSLNCHKSDLALTSFLQSSLRMTRHRLYHHEPRYVRDCLRQSRLLAKQIHEFKKALVKQLEVIDRKRLYVRMGYKSLRAYCYFELKFTRRQSQSLESAVREYRNLIQLRELEVN